MLGRLLSREDAFKVTVVAGLFFAVIVLIHVVQSLMAGIFGGAPIVEDMSESEQAVFQLLEDQRNALRGTTTHESLKAVAPKPESVPPVVDDFDQLLADTKRRYPRPRVNPTIETVEVGPVIEVPVVRRLVEKEIPKIAEYRGFDEDYFQLLLSQGRLVALYFHADWSSRSRLFQENVIQELPKVSKHFVMLRVDYDQARWLKAKYGVYEDTTVILLKGEDEVLYRGVEPRLYVVDNFFWTQ